MRFHSLSLTLLLAALGSAHGAPEAAADQPVDFNRDIRPILSNTCFKCHGFDDKERQAELRLDTAEGLAAVLPSGTQAVVAGNSAASGLYQRITSANADERMPPEGSSKVLTPEQIELLRRWIDEGAPFAQHWSFVPPERSDPPAVQLAERVANPIDAFVLTRLEREGLALAPEADKTTLIRRLSLDLTGLPPTPAEVDAFLADSTPEAYANLVERLLASPRFGEHQARYWLDVARYGDTHGLHLDNERSLWPYRDWVISAFNANLPFDQFTIQQLAGDLLPNPAQDQIVATGFNRCNVSTSEGGSIDDEVRVRYAVDRTETMSTVFLGLTLGCAVCHNHKYDPVSQKEFYQLYAFFNNVNEAAMDGNALLPPPIQRVPLAEQSAEQTTLREQLTALESQLATEVANVSYAEPPGVSLLADQPHEYVWIDDDLPPGAEPSADAGGWQWVEQIDRPVYSGRRAMIRQATGLSQHFFTNANPQLRIGAGDRLFAYVLLDPANPPKSIMLQFNREGSWEQRAYWGEDVIPFGQAGTPGHVAMGPLPAVGQWVRLEIDPGQVGLQPGQLINGWAFTQFDGACLWDHAGILTRVPQGDQQFRSLAAWLNAVRLAPDAAWPQPVRDALAAEPAARSPEQLQQLLAFFVTRIHPETQAQFAGTLGQIAAAQTRLQQLEAEIPQTMVMADLTQPRESFMLLRGAYDKPADKVAPAVPAIFPPLPDGAPHNRLGLALWLTRPDHPLTARVTVNRFWQQLFGRGIVKTSEDFGSQGELPTHPELLDWLASEFVSSGWNVKHLLRLMVGSSTYRQASVVSPELAARDPENRLLARGPRFRLDAEAVRDNALAIAGLLVERIGGRSVKPYQPEGLWEAVGFQGSTTLNFVQDHGEALYRRSMYTFWKRTSPPPSLLTFDAPSRETCTARRGRTNTPLQALVLLNDVQYVEAARNLAQRMMLDAGATPAERIAHGFRLATARPPLEGETAVLQDLYARMLARYVADATAAEALVKVGESPRNESLPVAELAAWTMVANTILNLDETITKE